MNRILPSVVLLVTCWSVILADTVELKNGQKVIGSFKQAGLQKVSIIVGGQIVSFDTNQVRAIYFGSDSGTPAPQLIVPPAPVQPPAPLPPPPPVENKLLNEAITALQALRSVSNSNPTYGAYSPRVIDAKIIVDRYLEKPQPDEVSVRAHLNDAMELYSLVSLAWGNRSPKTQQGFGILASLGNSRVLNEKCPDIIASADAMSKHANHSTWNYGFYVANNIEGILRAASNELDLAIAESKPLIAK